MVGIVPAEEGRVLEGAAGSVEPCHEGIIEAVGAWGEGAWRGGEAAVSGACYGGTVAAVQRYGRAIIPVAPTEEGGEDEGAAGGVEPHHEGIGTGSASACSAAEGPVEHAGSSWEVVGPGLARHGGTASAIQRKVESPISAAPAEEGGVFKCAAGDVEPRHEDVAAVQATIERAWGGGKVTGTGVARHGSEAAAVQRNSLTVVVAVTAEKGAVQQLRRVVARRMLCVVERLPASTSLRASKLNSRPVGSRGFHLEGEIGGRKRQGQLAGRSGDAQQPSVERQGVGALNPQADRAELCARLCLQPPGQGAGRVVAQDEVDARVQVVVAHFAPHGDLGPPLGWSLPISSSLLSLRAPMVAVRAAGWRRGR